MRRAERSDAMTVATYFAMLVASIALGYLVFRFFSGPLNRKLRAGGR